MSDESHPAFVIEPRRLHPISIVFDALDFGLRDLLFVGLVVVASRLVLVVVAGLVLLLVLRALEWSRRTYSFDGSVLRLDEGLFERRVRRIPADRVQEVEVIRTLRHRLFDTATLRVDTAGGHGESELRLEVVGEARARRLREAILAARHATPEQATASLVERPPPPERVVMRLGLPQLMVTGMTGVELLFIVVAAGWLFALFQDVPASLLPDLSDDVRRLSEALVVMGLVVGIGVAWIALAAGAAVFSYFGFTLSQGGDEVKIVRGLLDRRESAIPLERVQSVAVTTNPLRRRLGYCALEIHSAGHEGRDRRSKAVIPLATDDQAHAVLAVVLPAAAPLPDLTPAPRRALGRQVRRHAGVGALLALPFAVWLRPWGLAALALVGVVGALGVSAYRGLGYHASPDLLAGRRGALQRHLELVPTAKLQSARRVSSVFQRRRRLATLHLDVASRLRSPRIVDQDEDVVEDLLETESVTRMGRRDDVTMTRLDVGS